MLSTPKFNLDDFKRTGRARTRDGREVMFVAHDPSLLFSQRVIIVGANRRVATRCENGRLSSALIPQDHPGDLVEVVEPKRALYCFVVTDPEDSNLPPIVLRGETLADAEHVREANRRAGGLCGPIVPVPVEPTPDDQPSPQRAQAGQSRSLPSTVNPFAAALKPVTPLYQTLGPDRSVWYRHAPGDPMPCHPLYEVEVANERYYQLGRRAARDCNWTANTSIRHWRPAQ